MISENIDTYTFSVTVREGDTSTTHDVEVNHNDYLRLCDGEIPVEILIERSFEFLLDRELKESILNNINLKIISRYFPEYEREIKALLNR